MKASLFTITAQTNLHPGSGDANYGIIDKLVQRDTLSDLPTIHTSSLKGAILQHFFKQNPEEVTDAYIDEVFGGQNSESKRRDRKRRDESKTGEFVFMQAQLLSLPVRSNPVAFFRVASTGILSDLRQSILNVGLAQTDNPLVQTLELLAKESNEQPVVLEENHAGKHQLEDLKNLNFIKTAATGSGLDKVKALLGAPVVVVSDELMSQLADNHHLPVIARNHLENGQSTNLWYEQVLPRQTRFAFVLLRPAQPRIASDFDARLTQQGLVQIGANATVGYGYCEIKPVTF
ncbi:MAG: type III-B CRISPR module RAMP protein Cmr4 [Saprospiraceae bacterium]